jgi:pantoate--beta-alanine ligase
MKTMTDKLELQEQLAEWRSADEHIAIVPTMGNLHAGHISLVEAAREHAERVVVTVFVNPTQFGEGEDFDSYPRTLEKDTRRLRQASADVLFVPSVETMYPFGVENATRVVVPGLTGHLCGASRPGHFDGVTTVVARLFGLVQPDVALFGQKDYQQQLVIRRMVEDLNLPITILTVPTVREADGLAMSSRNAYLDETQRQAAPALHECLRGIEAQLRGGARDFRALECSATDSLAAAGFDPEYVAVRSAEDLGEPGENCSRFVVLGAGRLGEARLIDNLLVDV